MSCVDIFVGNETLIDPDIYTLWLNGYSAQEAAHIQHKRGIHLQYGATRDMLLSDIMDHYRTFVLLERYLKTPTKISDQLAFQITSEKQKLLIQKYYKFDEPVVRELLGKKLTSRHRNSLDDISEKTRIPLRSCRRQFDNVKRVFKTVEEMTGSMVENIKTHFLLAHELAQQYAAIVFITNNRFETTKRKLTYLTFGDFVHCANEMSTNWSYSSKDCQSHQNMDQDIDRHFLVGLRDMKSLSDRDHLDEHKLLVCKELQGKLSANADLDSNFKNLSKILINIAYSLNHSKELRDLFIDLVEEFIVPCKQAGWTASDVREFLNTYKATSTHLTFIRTNSTVGKVWERYLKTVCSCIVQMYHA